MSDTIVRSAFPSLPLEGSSFIPCAREDDGLDADGVSA